MKLQLHDKWNLWEKVAPQLPLIDSSFGYIIYRYNCGGRVYYISAPKSGVEKYTYYSSKEGE